jgi:hypothetical protein
MIISSPGVPTVFPNHYLAVAIVDNIISNINGSAKLKVPLCIPHIMTSEKDSGIAVRVLDDDFVKWIC